MAYLNKDLSKTRANNFEPIPPGKYMAQIIDSQEKEARSGDFYLAITWEVLEGEYRGRKVFDSLMLTGSPKAVEIGDGKLKGMAEAVCLPNPNYIGEASDLHGRPCLIKVKIEEGKNGYEDQNRITSFAKLEDAAPAAPAPGASIPAHSTPPPQGYGPPPQDYGPPPQGYAQPARGQAPAPKPSPAAPVNQATADTGYNQTAMRPGGHPPYPANAAAPAPAAPAPSQSAPPAGPAHPAPKEAAPGDDMPWDNVPF